MFGGLENIHRLEELVWRFYVKKNTQVTSLDSSSGGFHLPASWVTYHSLILC